ncbi:MAG: hypothetical protein ACK4ZX_04620 [Thermus sp.]
MYLEEAQNGNPNGNSLTPEVRQYLQAIQAQLNIRREEDRKRRGITPPTTPTLSPVPRPPEGPMKAGHQVPPPVRTFSLFSLVERALERYDLGLSPRDLYVYASMLSAGLYRLKLQGKPITKSLRQVVLFVPVEALAVALDMAPRTLYRALERLKEAGLVAGRTWWTRATVHGKPGVYRAGVVFAVRLPHRDGRARVHPEDLQHPWRDLDGDIQEGYTAWADLVAWREKREASPSPSRRVAESKNILLREDTVKHLLSWEVALAPVLRETDSPSLEVDSATPAPGPVEALLNGLLHAKPEARRRLVEEVALGLAKEFRDPHSTRFYAWAIWHAFRADLYGYAPEAMRILLWAIWRVREALHSGKLRRPGALLAKLLKDQGLLDLFRQAPSWRVA